IDTSEPRGAAVLFGVWLQRGGATPAAAVARRSRRVKFITFTSEADSAPPRRWRAMPRPWWSAARARTLTAHFPRVPAAPSAARQCLRPYGMLQDAAAPPLSHARSGGIPARG